MIALLLILAAAPVPPTLATLANLGGTRGKPVTLTLAGQNIEAPKDLYLDAQPMKAKFDGAVATFTLPKDAALGVHGLRLVTDGGISNARPFAVDDLAEVQAAEGRTKKETAQAIASPCVVVGVATTEASDFFKVTVKANQTLTFDLLGRRLGSPFDPVLVLHDAKSGRERPGLYADDTIGLQGDARLTHTFPKDGEVLVEVRDATFRGGAEYGYRLRISDGTAAYLLAALLITGEMPAILEVESNDDVKAAATMKIPFAVRARFETKNDRDCFAFHLKKGDKVRIVAEAREFGFSTEPLLTLLGPEGKELVKSNTEKLPAAIDFDATADGRYVVMAEELNYAFGLMEWYRVSVTYRVPDARVSLGGDHLAVPGTLPIAALDRLEGYDGAIGLKWIGDGEFVIKPIAAKAVVKPDVPLKLSIEAKPGTKPGVYFGRLESAVKAAPTHAVPTAEMFRKEWSAIPVAPAELNGRIAIVVR